MINHLYRHIASWAGFFLLAALLISCAKESSVVDSPEVKQPTQPAQTPIALSAYTAQPIAASTRADQSLLADHGIPNGKSIGVFAYYHQGTDSNSDGIIDTDGTWTGSETPNFMFNQQATCSTADDAFIYAPLKYWPNTPHDKLSFIGYYPYTTNLVGESPSDDRGIALSSNVEGLPAFELTVSNDVTKQVDFLISDLLTGLPNGTSAVSPSSAVNREGLTIIDRVRLLFHHATSKVTIRIAIDEEIREDFMSMTISNLELTNIYRKGTVTPSYASATGTTINVTEDKTDPDYKTTYKIVDASVNPVVNHLTDTYLMLPQTLVYDAEHPDVPANNAQINISYSITLRSHGTVYTYDGAGNPVETDHYTYSNTASLPLAEMKMASAPTTAITSWLPNHHYIYTIRLTAKRIEFTGEVVEWGQEVPWDNIVVDQIGT